MSYARRPVRIGDHPRDAAARTAARASSASSGRLRRASAPTSQCGIPTSKSSPRSSAASRSSGRIASTSRRRRVPLPKPRRRDTRPARPGSRCRFAPLSARTIAADVEARTRREATASAWCAFCSTSRIVVPASVDLADHAGRSSAPGRGESPSDGSSSSSSRGRDISARPIASICCSPPDIVPAFCSSRSRSRGNVASTRSVSARDSRRRRRTGEGSQLEILADRHPREHAPAFGGMADRPAARSRPAPSPRCRARRTRSSRPTGAPDR